jgi:DNA excision repair protein ERCC-2
MTETMFCPNCKSLLTLKRKGKTDTKFCKGCGYREGSAVQEKPVVQKVQRKGAHPDYPLFPYEKIRDGQREFMQDLRTAVQEGKVLIGQAPTGIGKTVATLSIFLEDSMKTGRLVFFLTSKQSQHRIVVDTLREMSETSARNIKVIDVISKQAMCPKSKGGMPGYAFVEFCKGAIKSRKCDLQDDDYEKARAHVLTHIMHVNEIVKLCRERNLCPHKVALDALGDVDVIVCDYNYIFDIMAPAVLEKAGRELEDIDLIIDEAHNLPDRIRANMSMEFTAFKMGEAVKEGRKVGQRGARYTAGLKNAIDAWAGKLSADGETYVEKDKLIKELDRIFSQSIGEKESLEDYVKWLAEAGEKTLKSGADTSCALELAEFLRSWPSDEDTMVRILTGHEGGSWTLKLCFLDPKLLAGPIFEEVHSAVLMSGTLYPPDMYGDVLGVPLERRLGRAYDSPFPKENRKVLAVREVTTRYVKRGKDMNITTAEHVMGLARAAEGNVAAFFPSYRLIEGVADRIGKTLRGPELLVETQGMTKSDREAYLRHLRSHRANGCLLLAVQGGSLSEGIDYHDNLLSAVAIIGIPLAPPNLEVKALTNHYTNIFGREKGYLYGYMAPAFNKVVQGAGRLIRSETDRGVIVLMDERFVQSRYLNLLPPDLRPVPLGSVGELEDSVSVFFKENK